MPETSPLPEIPYDAWEPTKATLHLATQIVGKIKLTRHPKQSHWWHTTLHVTPRGIGTRTIPVRDKSFELEIDVHDLRLEVRTSDGVRDGFPLTDRSIADVYRETMAMLDRVGYSTRILGEPYDNPHSTIPFAQDEEHRSWNHEHILAWWRSMLFVDDVFKTFAGRSFMRTSPVHLYWHSFDIAVTRFTGRRSPSFGEGDRRSDVEAYSHEVISFGYWPGDPQVRFPAFYSYTAPEPEGLAARPLRPEAAWWHELPSSHMALLKYDDVRTADNPRKTLLSFLQSAFEAGCTSLDLDPEELRTDPLWSRLDERFPGTRGTEVR